MNKSLRKARFTIETFPDNIFEGYTLDEEWNGWACPYFDSAEANHILDLYNKNNGKGVYDESKDEFVFIKDEEVYPALEIQKSKLYPIGNSVWIWEETNN